MISLCANLYEVPIKSNPPKGAEFLFKGVEHGLQPFGDCISTFFVRQVVHE